MIIKVHRPNHCTSKALAARPSPLHRERLFIVVTHPLIVPNNLFVHSLANERWREPSACRDIFDLFQTEDTFGTRVYARAILDDSSRRTTLTRASRILERRMLILGMFRAYSFGWEG